MKVLGEIPLATGPCGSCHMEPAWLWPNGDVLCAQCFHDGEKPTEVKSEIRAHKVPRQHPEGDLQKQVIDLAHRTQWMVHH